MPVVNLPYVDAALADLEEGGRPASWRHLHWGLFEDPALGDDSAERYHVAAEALTEHILAVAGVGDGSRILDVGCGFGGTLDAIARRHQGCRTAGLNIDIRQLLWARRLQQIEGAPADRAARTDGALPTGGAASTGGAVPPGGAVPGRDAQVGRAVPDGATPAPFVAADGCQLPIAAGSLDHVLAVECVFHFPSRKAFFREASRVLRSGGTLALSDFLVAPEAMATVASAVQQLEVGDWYGRSARPLTSAGYARLARSAGLEVVVDHDITRETLPTYPARRRLYREAGATEGIATLDALEKLATTGHWQYHVLAFRRR